MVRARAGRRRDDEPRGLARRLAGFATLPFLSLLAPFLFLPLLARLAGTDAWVAIAIGQSAGGAAALVVGLGYNTVGPTQVALTTQSGRPGLLAASIRARALLVLPAGAIAAIIALVLVPASEVAAGILMAVAMTLSGLSSAWYSIGLGRAGQIVLYEFLPRITATVLGAVALIATGSVIAYPLLLIAAALISVALYVGRTMPFGRLLTGRTGEMTRTFRHHRAAWFTEVSAGAYNVMAVTLVGAATVPAQAATYVSGDKLYRIGQYSVSALGSGLQGWVVEAGSTGFPARIRRAVLSHLVLGVTGLALFPLLGPFLSGLLFGETTAIDLPTAWGFGVATFFIALGTAAGRLTLISLGARREFMISVIAASVIGVAAILTLGSLYGAAGAAWGLALGEAVSVTAQAISIARVWRRERAFVVRAGVEEPPVEV